jgi:hypothetical protein
VRRWRERYEVHGYDGLFDWGQGQPSPKRVPMATVEQVLGLRRVVPGRVDGIQSFEINDRGKA